MPLDASIKWFLQKAVSADASNLAWGAHRLEAYLRELKRKTGADEIDWGRSKQILCDDAVPWIERYDPDLELFSKYHRDFELGRAKATGIFKMPQKVRGAEEAIRRRLKPLVYDVKRSLTEQGSEATVLEVFAGAGRVSLTVAENTVSRVKVPIPEGAIGGLTTQVQRWAESNLPGFSELKRLMVDAAVIARTVTTVSLNFDDALVEIATDTFRVGRGGEQEVTDYAKRFVGALNAAYKALPESDEFIQDTILNALITPGLAQKFRKIAEPKLVVTSYAIKYDGGISKERIANEISSQNEFEIANRVAEHYRKRKDLSDFFATHTQYDPDSVAPAHKAIKGLSGFSEVGCTCLFFFIRPMNGADSERAKLRVGNEIVDSIRVIVDTTHGLIRGSSKENTTEQLDVVLTEIRHLLPPRI